MSFQIAIDGPAGAGKSTIAKLVAKKKGYIYVDTGAMYRAMALFMIRKNIDGNDEEAVGKECAGADIGIAYRDGEQVVLLDGENVNSIIRTEEVGNMASLTAKNPRVRERLVILQKELASRNNVVMDGRDIGTVVLPDADVKIYLTASVEVRAKRRYDEIISKGEKADLQVIEEDIRLRDKQDMEREVSPLRKAEDAIEVDSSYLTIEEVTDRILSLCDGKGNT
ncbi:MAG: (d)CMP kinase [Lachnospiraceae bacterium]|nr:(d)CMP kinase [Lachnospiraceae bacterium]